jgi:hypothetical protein
MPGKAGRSRDEPLEHLRVGFDGGHAVSERDDPAREQAGPGADVDHVERLGPEHPFEGLGRIARPRRVIEARGLPERARVAIADG